jgi:hypothetical protein
MRVGDGLGLFMITMVSWCDHQGSRRWVHYQKVASGDALEVKELRSVSFEMGDRMAPGVPGSKQHRFLRAWGSTRPDRVAHLPRRSSSS